MLEIINVSKVYALSKVISVPALQGVHFTCKDGEMIALQGPSGSGKSTLLNIMGLLDEPDSGEYRIDGQVVEFNNSKALATLRSTHFGFIFQNYNLIPELDVARNIEIPLLIKKIARAQRMQLVDQVIADVGLSERRQHRPSELSGGQQQRVAIARALVRRPRVLFADEPTANLDTVNSLAILELMQKLNVKYGLTIIFATHDQRIRDFVHTSYNMIDGRLENNI